MPSESQIPIASQDAPKRFAARLALFYGTLFGLGGTYLPFFPVWLKAVGIDPSWIGIITAVPSVTRFTMLPLVTGLCRTASIAARRHDRHRLCDRAWIFGGRHPASAVAGVSRLRRHRLRVDADGAADGRLCVARRGAVRPQLRTAAVMGLGGLHRRRAGMRAAGRCHRGPAPDLGHCRRWPGSAPSPASGCSRWTIRRSPLRCCPARAPCCAIPAFSPSSSPRR